MSDSTNLSLTQATTQTFFKAGSKYVSDKGIVTIHQRKEWTERKPKHYVLFQPSGEAKPKYLTGLYPQSNGGFIGEFNRVFWRINLTDDSVTFQRIGGGEGESAYE